MIKSGIFPILIGLLIAQAIATFQVYVSNIGLFHTTNAIATAGYLAVPNTQVMQTLTHLGPAFFGGLFFTFTVGAGLALLSFLGAWFWEHGTGKNNTFLALLGMLWLMAIIQVNVQSPSLPATAYFLLIPFSVFSLTLRQMPSTTEEKTTTPCYHIIFFMILVIIGTIGLKGNSFTKIRDNILLSNPVGIRLNKFYYDYTLYAAEAFKSQSQKQLRVCCLSLGDALLSRRMENVLRRYDYLVLPEKKNIPFDMAIEQSSDMLIFKHHHKEILQISSEQFFHNPKKWLRKFSQKTDHHMFLRWFAFHSLQLVCAVIFYLILYFPFRLLAGFFLTPRHASLTAGIICIIIGAILLIPLGFGEKKQLSSEELAAVLTSDNWHQRVAVLRSMEKQKRDITRFPAYKKLLDSPHIAERLRLARALSISRSPESGEQLLKMLDDTQFNVVYNALYALGNRRERKAKEAILNRIRTSDNWYVQWYAYKALRRIGWTQAKKDSPYE